MYPPQPEKVVILTEDARGTTREVEVESWLITAEIIQTEHQIIGEFTLVPPHDPSDTGVHQTVLVARYIDALHSRYAEIPLKIREHKGSHKAA